jgi:hypothetical protein
MGRIFCVESKSFEFVLDSGGKSLCLKIIERGLGSVCSVRLGHEGIFWLLSTIEGVASSVNSKGFFRKIRTARSVFLSQRSFNIHGTYLAIEEFNGGGRRGFILLPEGKEKWGWCGFGKVLRFLLAPYLTVKQLPPTFHGDPCIGKSVSHFIPAVKTTCTSALGATSSSVTASMAVGKHSKSKTVVTVQTLSTGTQFPPAALATGSGVMPSSYAASMEDGQNRTKPAPDVRTNQRTQFGTSKKNVAYRSNSHSCPRHTYAGTSVGIETKEGDNSGGSKRLGQPFFLLGKSSSPSRTAVGLSWVAIYASLWMGGV